MRHIIISINSEVPIVTGETPIIIIDKKSYYVLNDKLAKSIYEQIGASVQDTSAYNVVGYIDNGVLKIDDKNNTVQISGYDMQKYLWEDVI